MGVTPVDAGEARFTAAQRMLAIRFTGSGSEYFRIWIVNLLLMLVTLGFHGDPRKMMRGYLLMLLLALLYGVAGKVSPVAGLIAVLALAAARISMSPACAGSRRTAPARPAAPPPARSAACPVGGH